MVFLRQFLWYGEISEGNSSMKWILLLIILVLSGLGVWFNRDHEVEVSVQASSPILLERSDLKNYSEAYWYQEFPTVGLRVDSSEWPCPYPFIPHCFSLWDLAPHQGEGVTLALLDNGVAGVRSQTERYLYHPDIALTPDALGKDRNIVDRHLCKRTVRIDSPYGIEIDERTLPIPERTGSAIRPHQFHHGSHVYSLIAGTAHDDKNPGEGLCGLAPRARVLVFKVCNDKGVGKLSDLIKGIQAAARYKVTILNISLAVRPLYHEELTTSQVQAALGSIPYTVVAAGNSPRISRDIMGNSTLSIGSFGVDNRSAYIPQFSQFSDFAMPGCSILGPVCSSSHPRYALQQGTSLSAALFSGFLALVQGEFHDTFSHRQYMDIFKAASFTLCFTPEWTDRVRYGVVDMRMALFMLHVLKRLNHMVPQASFSLLVESVRERLIRDPRDYALKKNCTLDFTTNFMDYYRWARSQPRMPAVLYQRKDREVALHHVVQSIIQTCSSIC